ncbi:MAG TPA: efflux RND transporter periplasmic adaptor subunit [Planctomycetota bacterium]|nr:efflux RND transporter periplasmic adaptor subunit [Planctomycetota bacterium]HRR80750.1 efflux RND transporter periplasmic adaptor subunit [Planctomycetota bacterium]HRT97153.1 efflux RND transporter periplasmic adaptor subunit [Planctomycetota bacterium]
MRRRTMAGGLLVVLVALAARHAGAGEAAKEAPKDAPKEAPKPTTHTVKPELFKVEAQLKGVFETPHVAEVVFRPEAWAELTVLEAAAPGTPVKKGDVILSLDPQKIDEAIKDAEAALAQMDPALKVALEELAAAEKTLAMDLAAAERAKQYADEDLQRYTETDRPMAVKQAHVAVQNATNYLEYETEELRQLEKMYKADDLTEETEEIILKRQRDTVERAKFALELAKQKSDQTLRIELPRQDIATKESATRQAVGLVKAKVAIPASLTKKRLDVEKGKTDQAKAAERLAKMKKDREAMVVKAPCDGVVYMGGCVRGAWPRLGQTLERGAQLKPHDVVMSVVVAKDLFVRAAVPEEQLERVAPGGEAEVVPVGFPSTKLAASLDSLSPVPVTPGNFEAKFRVTVPPGAPPLVPGMNANVKLTSYEKRDALAVPVAALATEGEATFVWVQKAEGGSEKRAVTVGRRSDGKAEITKGLSAGDVVLLERPEK